MQLDPKEKSRVWWKGALKGAASGLVVGVAVGFLTAAVLYGLATFVAPAALAGIVGFVSSSTGFYPLTMMAFSAAISSVTGLITGGSQAVAAYHQQKHNARDEAKIIELDGRTRALEQAITPSRQVDAILARGARTHESFRDAETERAAQQAPSTPTIH